MKCKNPYREGGQEFPCRTCLPCRINRQRLWSARLQWEAGVAHHVGRSWFVTLTYNDENLPEDRCVRKRPLQLFVKRLRAMTDDKIRYFGVGEYGERNWRPHFHICIFGLTDRSLIEKCWRFGFVHIGLVEGATIRYVTGYCIKGFTSSRSVLKGLTPEFGIMSTRPGIGAGVVDNMPLAKGGIALVDVLDGRDVPGVLRAGGRLAPMGTYLRNRLRTRLGRAKGLVEEELKIRTLEYWQRVKTPGELEKMKAERVQDEYKAESYLAIQRSKRMKL